jgi:hypothetical protein
VPQVRDAMRGLVAVAALLAVLAPAASAARPRAACNGEVRLCERPLDDVVFPSAHNAMSARSLGWTNPDQPVAIPAQLRAGIRGLLFDTYYAHRRPDGTVVKDETPTPASRLYLCHTACQIGAAPLRPVLRQIRRFLARHPRNVLVFDIEDYVHPGDFARAMRRTGLLRHVYHGAPGPRWPTLRTLIDRRRQVVVLVEHDAGHVPWIHAAYEGVMQETNYGWTTPGLITRRANWAASCAPNRGGTTGSLFLLNHWSPPYPTDPGVAARVNRARTLVGRARTCHRLRGHWPTLLAVDWFTAGGLFRAAHRLNTLAGR